MLNERLAQSLGKTLEEATNMVTDSMVLRHLGTKGSVTLEEAEFYHNMCSTVIMEAAEDFIPDEVEVDDAPSEAEGIELYDAAGNAYLFDPASGSLTPIDAGDSAPDASEQAPDLDPALDPAAAPEPEAPAVDPAQDPMEENTQIPAQAQAIEESTQIVSASPQSSVVSKILANLA